MSSPTRTISRNIRRTNETKLYWRPRPVNNPMPTSIKQRIMDAFKRRFEGVAK